MEPIPPPELLEPDRVLTDNQERATGDAQPLADRLTIALNESCAYAQQLWRDLDAVRGYLIESLPPESDSPGAHSPGAQTSASPTGPDDGQGWDNWIAAYAAVTSTLCGPRGAPGFGLEEARREARLRRGAPAPVTHLDDRPAQPDEKDPVPEKEEDAAPSASDRPERPGRGRRTAGTVIVLLLALRGLRPRRGSRNPA